MKVRTKNTLLFLVISLIPLIGMGKFAYENGKQAIKDNLGVAFEQLAHTQIKKIEERLEDVYQDTMRWSRMSIMQEVVIGDMNASIQSFLMDMKKDHDEFTYLSVINPEGRVVASTLPEMLDKDFPGVPMEAFIGHIKAGRPHVSDVHYSNFSKAWEITFSFPIKTEFAPDNVAGIILVGWNAATLSRMVHLSADEGTEQGVKGNHFMLMRNDGLVIAAPGFEQKDVFKVNLIERGLRSALLASRQNKGHLIEKDEHNAESLIGYDYTRGQNDFPDMGWFGFVLSNTATAFASIERLKGVTLFAGLIVIFIVIVLSIIASGKMTTPLLDIARAADKVSRGDFQTRIAVRSKDEFGNLARAFNAMAEDLQDTTVTKEYVDSIIANMSNSLFVLSPEGNIKTVNEAACKLVGYEEGGLIGQGFDKLVAWGGATEELGIEFIKKNPSIYNVEGLFSGRSGKAIPVLFSASPMRDAQNNVQAFVCVVQDISERKLKENALRQAHQELAEREKTLRQMFHQLDSAHEELKRTQNQLVQSEKLASIGQLAAGVAHEINNPIGFIGSNLEMLTRYVSDYIRVLTMAKQLTKSALQGDSLQTKAIAEEMTRLEKETNLDYIINDANDLLEHNRKGIDRIHRIVMDLRTFAREDKDEMEEVKIDEVIESILNIVHNELKYKAKLEKNYDDTPPVRCNPRRLGQVFLNLTVNALQAIEGSGTIGIKTYKQGEFVCVDVRDTGKGIPEENLSKIFDPFFTTKPVGQGTGLGLSVSYEIVKKHGGAITVQSKVGVGTTMTVMLPINREKGEGS